MRRPTKFPPAAVGYIRMSSDDQERSPKQQREQIIALATRLGCKVIRWYQDLGISGNDSKRRKVFRQMMSDASTAHDFEVILCWSQDRFGRFDSLEAGEWVAPLRRAGIKLVTVAEGEINWSDTTGRLVYTIQQESKNAFLHDLARNTTRGRCEAARQVGFVGGKLPYGYDKIVSDGRGRFSRRVTNKESFRRPEGWKAQLVPSSDVVKTSTVKRIFREYCRGQSVEVITHRLNSEGIPSPGGKTWYTITVRNILRNPVYVGDQVWNRRHSGKYFSILDGEVTSEASRTVQRGDRTALCCQNHRMDWIVIHNAHPAIVSRKVFEQAQSRINQRVGRLFQRRGLPLTGLLRCGHCGASMSHRNRIFQVKGKQYSYYTIHCPTANKRGTSVCASRVASEAQLRSFIVHLLFNRVVDDDCERRLRDRLVGELLDLSRDPTECQRLKDAAERLARRIDRASENLLRADQSCIDTAVAKLERWHREREAVVARLLRLEAATPASIDAKVAEMMAEVRSMRFGLASADRALLHHTLQQLVERIVLRFEPDPARPGCSRLAGGTVCVKTPWREEIDFTRTEMDQRFPRSQFWQVRSKPAGRVQKGSSRECALKECGRRGVDVAGMLPPCV